MAAGEVTPTSALLWTRAPKAGKVSLELAESASTSSDSASSPRATARQANDLTVRRAGQGAGPNTGYLYRFRQGNAASQLGSFRTAPAPTAARDACASRSPATPTPRPGANGKPAYNGFQVYARMAAERNDFNINLGDTIYSDSEVGGAKVARTSREKWAKYRQNLSLAPLRTLRASAGTYSHWDDHEFINDFSRAEHGDAIYAAGRKAFTDYSPVRTGADGLYRTFRWGKHVELFFLDERSFRSAKASAGRPVQRRRRARSRADGAGLPSARRSRCSCRRSRSPSRRRASTRSTTPRARCSAPASSPASCATCADRRRRSR